MFLLTADSVPEVGVTVTVHVSGAESRTPTPLVVSFDNVHVADEVPYVYAPAYPGLLIEQDVTTLTVPFRGQFSESGPTPPDTVENVIGADCAENGPELGVNVAVHVSATESVTVKDPLAGAVAEHVV